MKKLIVPYIESLNDIGIERTGDILEEKGKREALDELNWAKDFPYRPITTFNIGYSKDALYIKYDVHGSMLRAIYVNDQDPVYQDSSVEFFCKKPGDDYYMNFEFNCIGTCLAKKRKGRHEEVTPLTPEELADIERFSALGRRAFKEIEGMFTWDLIIKIPFHILQIDKDNLPEKLLGNFYKCADATGSPHYLSWTPVKTPKPDFHRPEFFGEIYFEK